jgi:hypothetical protein
VNIPTQAKVGLEWATGQMEQILPMPGEAILRQLIWDLDSIPALRQGTEIGRARRRIAWFSLWLDARTTVPYGYALDLATIRARALSHALPRAINLRNSLEVDFDADTLRDLEQVLTLIVKTTRECSQNLEHDLDLLLRGLSPTCDRNLSMGLARARDLDVLNPTDFDRARILMLQLNAKDTDTSLALSTFMLNWLCAVEKRVKGGLPITEALWIARVRKVSEDTDGLPEIGDYIHRAQR